MLGIITVYDRVPFFFSDQCDVGMQFTGSATGWDQVIFRGDPSDQKFVVFWLKDVSIRGGEKSTGRAGDHGEYWWPVGRRFHWRLGGQFAALVMGGIL